MKQTYLVGVCVIVLVAAVVGWCYYSAAQKDALRFSNTQEWDPDFYEAATSPAPTLGGSAFDAAVPAPPANISEETEIEIAGLYKLTPERSEVKKAEIELERSFLDADFHGLTYNELFTDEARPETALLLQKIEPLFKVVVMREKLEHDRVRPSHLDPELSTTIPVPLHPAYPSGHASRAYLIAFILGELQPDRADLYLVDAARIARNREVAGVHYPSDAVAGKMLAEQFFAALKADAELGPLLENAKTEW